VIIAVVAFTNIVVVVVIYVRAVVSPRRMMVFVIAQ